MPDDVTWLRRAGRRLPRPLREALWRRTVGSQERIDWGDLRRTEPFSREWGAERGLPVDRVYIERFLERHAADVRGEALEIHGSLYTERYGGDRVTTAHVLDLDSTNPAATIVGDLEAADTLPEGRFDCFVLTQTLQFVADAAAATSNAYRSLAPGGVLLLTVPSISQLERGWPDLWRWTPMGLERFLDEALPAEAERELGVEGNVLTAVAFLFGLAAADLRHADYEARDSSYPLILTARIRKPASSES
jgi:SAM-dependent methyltransferase